MARIRRRGSGTVRALCLDALLALWVGGMVVRAGAVLLAPFARWLDAVALIVSGALQR